MRICQLYSMIQCMYKVYNILYLVSMQVICKSVFYNKHKKKLRFSVCIFVQYQGALVITHIISYNFII